MTHICGARRRYGRGICQKPTPEGKRCRMHGGAPGSGIVTPEGFARCQAAKVVWLRANKKIPPWMHSMGGKARAATALRGAHLGGAFLPGSKPKQQAGPSRDKLVEKALERIRGVMTKIADDQAAGALPAVADKAWPIQTPGERLVTLTLQALDKWQRVLDPIIDPLQAAQHPPQMRLLQLQLETAGKVMAAQIRIGDQSLRRQEQDQFGELLDALEKTRSEM